MNITFRPIEKNDIKLRTKWLNNPEVQKNLGWQIRKGTTLKDQLKWFKAYKKDESDERFIILADKTPIGIVALTDKNPIDCNAMLYVLIGEDEYRGKGIGRSACEYIIDYGFDKLKLHKIYLEVNSYNNSAFNLYKSLGFTEEGRFKEQIRHNNQYYDEIYMGLINPNH